MIAAHMWTPQPVFHVITTFHMPVLFIISGYLDKNKDLYNTLKSLVTPVVFWSIICFVYTAIKDTSLLTTRLIEYSSEGKGGYFVGVWFIEALLLIKIVSYLSDGKYLKYISLFCIATMAVFPFHGNHIWNLYPMRFFSAFPFFWLGMVLRKKMYNAGWKRVPMIIAGLTILIIMQFDGYHNMHSNNFGISYITFFMGASVISLGLFTLCSYLKRNDFVETLSTGTILILGIHGILLDFLTPLLPGKLWPISYIIIPISIIIICYPIIKLSLKYCPLALGKYPRQA